MSNLASASEGAVITLASSNDTNYPPEAIIDGNPSTYWSTTGMFPQQVIVSFRSLVAMDTILVRCSKIARIRIERNDVPSLENFQTAVEKDAEDTDNDLQILKFELSMTTARNVKFVILKSYDHFVTIHSIVITGRTTTS